jgi:hypothetical protein
MGSWAIACFTIVGTLITINFVFIIMCIIGGFVDLMYLFQSLKKAVVDETDDGRVIKPSGTN